MADSSNPTAYIFYYYYPSLAAAVIFTVLFLASTLFHGYQLITRRTWYFIPFLIGGLFESVGYIGRAISSTQSPNWTTGPYVQQSLLLLLAPALFAASIYMILGRIIRLTDGETHSLIRAKWLTKIFVAGDVLSFLVQSSGGGLLATAKDGNNVSTGRWVITGGLIIQVVWFGFFIIVAAIFHYRIVRIPTVRSQTVTVPWQRYLLILYWASALIMIRSVFRIIEYVEGTDGYLLSYEVFIYVFDGTLMFITMVVFNVWHPSKIISKDTLERTDRTQDLEAFDLRVNNRKP